MKEIKGVMGELFSEEGLEELRLLLEIRERWNDIVGEKLASYTTPYKLDNGSLYIEVRSHAIAQEMHYIEKNILRKLQSMGIEKISIRVRNINLNKRLNTILSAPSTPRKKNDGNH